jgi:uncharacterized membrane protein YkgB
MIMNKKASYFLAHAALFIVFFWFGALKLFDVSPANNLVHDLLVMIPVMNLWPFESFIIVLGLFEMLIGVLFLFPRATRIAVCILIPHMLTTMLPLVLLPHLTWQSFLVPTLEGQYIIKNLVIVALALSVVLERRR